MATIKIKEVNKIAKQVKKSVDENQKIPTIEGYSWAEYGYILAKSVLYPGKDVIAGKVNKAPKPSGKYISRSIYEKDYRKIAKYVVNFVKQNKRLPNFVDWNGYRIRPALYIYAFAKIVKYYADNKKAPSYCNFNSKVFEKEKPVSDDEVFNYFVETFGKVTTIDGAFEKVQDRGYSYYYDDKYSNKTSIDRIKLYYGINCTDACQVFWHIGKALGYEVRCIHVLCSGGDGHVRLQFKHPTNTGGEWINRDPAAILDDNGASLTYNWCSSGYTLLATNPSWFLENVNR